MDNLKLSSAGLRRWFNRAVCKACRVLQRVLNACEELCGKDHPFAKTTMEVLLNEPDAQLGHDVIAVVKKQNGILSVMFVFRMLLFSDIASAYSGHEKNELFSLKRGNGASEINRSITTLENNVSRCQGPKAFYIDSSRDIYLLDFYTIKSRCFLIRELYKKKLPLNQGREW